MERRADAGRDPRDDERGESVRRALVARWDSTRARARRSATGLARAGTARSSARPSSGARVRVRRRAVRRQQRRLRRRTVLQRRRLLRHGAAALHDPRRRPVRRRRRVQRRVQRGRRRLLCPRGHRVHRRRQTPAPTTPATVRARAPRRTTQPRATTASSATASTSATAARAATRATRAPAARSATTRATRRPTIVCRPGHGLHRRRQRLHDDACDGAGTCARRTTPASCDDGPVLATVPTSRRASCGHAGDPCTGGSECSDARNEAADNRFDLAGDLHRRRQCLHRRIAARRRRRAPIPRAIPARRRAVTGECDIAETCTGASSSCPADVLVAGRCDPPSGRGPVRRAGAVQRRERGVSDRRLRRAGTECRVGPGSATSPSPARPAACPVNGFVPNGTSCNDGEECSNDDAVGGIVRRHARRDGLP